MPGIFFVIVNEITMAPWLYIDMCCTWLKWNPLHEMNEKMKTLTCLLWLFALCYNILISKENFCGTCILNQNFILRDIMTQLVKVTNVRKIEGYQELYTFIINWQPLKFQYESPKKKCKMGSFKNKYSCYRYICICIHVHFVWLQMGLLMFEAITVFSPSSSLIPSWQRSTKANIHGYMMAASLFSAIAGFIIIYYNKEINNKEHFTTWHGTMGLVTVLWVCVQCFGGVLLKYNNLVSSWKIRLADMKLYHATSGLCAFTLVSVTLVMALFSDWFSNAAAGTTWWGVFATLACLSLMVMQQITTAYLPQSRIVKPKPITSKQGKRKEKKKEK